jgi:hypothetical protein
VARERGLALTFTDAQSQEAAAISLLHGSDPMSPDELLTAINAASPFTCRAEGDALIVRRR